MRFRIGDRWQNGYLDYPLQSGQYRIEVHVWNALSQISGQYVEYGSADWRKVLNYIRQIGVVATLRKIYSRLRERHRNEKWLSVGLGRVLEARKTSDGWEPGALVAFLAYNHPQAVERVCIDQRFVTPIPDMNYSVENLQFFRRSIPDHARNVFEHYEGWSPFSGEPVESDRVRSTLRNVGEKLAGWTNPEDVCDPEPLGSIEERRAGTEVGNGPYDGVLFGFGNYAKTVILPNLPDKLDISCVHELDPLQLGNQSKPSQTLDTSPELRADEDYDFALIAGYHHTHTPLAVKILNAGGVAVTEKPFCTNQTQYRRLKDAVQSTSGRFFGCFHKRYSPLTEWAIEDLDLREGKVAHYHTIVYEIPLPPLHWYNWPASGSRIISNGCHWLDHFMYLNGYAKVSESTVQRFGNGDLTVRAELENGATFSMTLTEQGSPRLGVRDYVEVRAGTKTARLIDNCRYEAEDSTGIIRSESVNQMDSYARMYRSIGEAIVEERPGDEPKSLRSSQVMLNLEEKLRS